MGAPSQAQVEAWTDRQAFRIQQRIAGAQNEYGSQTAAALYNLVVASGDPDVVTALAAVALAEDRQALPEQFGVLLPALLKPEVPRALVTALALHVQSAAGGAYASLDAFLTARAAQVHPVWAELARAALGREEAISAANCFAPTYAAIAPAKVYAGTDAGSFTDLTSAAGNASTADLTSLFAANGDALYIGCASKFRCLAIGLSTLANVTIAPSIEYWNGNAWVAVSGLVDNSTGFTKNRSITWTLPTEWERCAADASGAAFADLTPYYYVRIARGAATLGTPPVGTCITLAPEAVLNSGGAHLGLPQGPLGIVDITAASTISLTILNTEAYARFAPNGLRARAASIIAQALTITASYTNQSGADVTQASSSWAAPAALGTKTLSLNGSDTGARALKSSGFAVSTTAVDGMFWVEAPELRTPAK